MSDSNLLHTHRLENGLQIVGQLMPDFETIALSYHVRTGTRDEADPAIFGVSHFLEHMIFKETKTLRWQQLKEEWFTAAFGETARLLQQMERKQETLPTDGRGSGLPSETRLNASILKVRKNWPRPCP